VCGKFETPGVEMLSGMQERTVLINESVRRRRRRAGGGAAWFGTGAAWHDVASACATRALKPRWRIRRGMPWVANRRG